MKQIFIFLFTGLFLFSCSGKDSPVTPASEDIIDIIAGDMTGTHEGQPHGVPMSYNWAKGPRVGMGSDPGTFKAMIAWGQVYEAAEGNPAVNSRVQLKNMRIYILSKTRNTWTLLQQSDNLEGSAYVENFAGDVNKPADVRVETDGGISVTAGGGYNFHFWPKNGRITINPNDIGGVITMISARLVVNDSTLTDDRDSAKYLLSVGGDYWASLTAQWDNFKTNGDIGIGKFKYVKKEWRMFFMSTLNEEELRKNPPPIEK